MNYELSGDDLDAYTKIRGRQTQAAYTAWMLAGLTYAYARYAPAGVAWISGGAFAVAVIVFFYFDAIAKRTLAAFAAEMKEEE